MSQTIYNTNALEPLPIPFGAMGPSDFDGAFLVDSTKAMQQRGTTITNVGTPIVQAYILDQLVTTGDMTVTNQAVVTTPVLNRFSGDWVQAGNGFTFQAQTHGAVVNYYLIGFPLTLANGSQITRWARIPIATNPG
jgi:hypothetical protein